LPNKDQILDSLRPGSREMERGRWEGQNFQLGSSAPGRRRRQSIRRKIHGDYIRHILYSNNVLDYKRLDSTRQFSFAVQEAKHELQTTKSLLHARKQITGNGNIQPTYQALRYLWEAMSGRWEISTLLFYCCSYECL